MKLTINRKLSIGLALIGLFYLVMAFQLPEYPHVPVDGDVIPKILGSILLILSILLFFDKKEVQKKVSVAKKEVLMLLGTIGLILIYILLLETVGFVLMTIIFLFTSTYFFGYRNHLINAIVSVLFTISMYLLFTEILMVRLPTGLLPI